MCVEILNRWIEVKILFSTSVASIGILRGGLSHTGIVVFSGSGSWGVSVFFILSGFLFVYTKINSNLSHVGIVGNIKRMFITRMGATFFALY